MVMDILSSILQYGTTEAKGELTPAARKALLMVRSAQFMSQRRAGRAWREGRTQERMNLPQNAVLPDGG